MQYPEYVRKSIEIESKLVIMGARVGGEEEKLGVTSSEYEVSLEETQKLYCDPCTTL